MPKLLESLKKKLESQGSKDPHGLAVYILKKNGYMKEDGTLTVKGAKKQSEELFGKKDK